jgi:hypothetical protein
MIPLPRRSRAAAGDQAAYWLSADSVTGRTIDATAHKAKTLTA